VIAVYSKNDMKQIITLQKRGGEHRFLFTAFKQVVHTLNHCLRGLSYVVTIWLPLVM